jgi:hypothetical protein
VILLSSATPGVTASEADAVAGDPAAKEDPLEFLLLALYNICIVVLLETLSLLTKQQNKEKKTKPRIRSAASIKDVTESVNSSSSRNGNNRKVDVCSSNGGSSKSSRISTISR